jgi:hypothetical protein
VGRRVTVRAVPREPGSQPANAHIAGGTGLFANAAGTFTGSVSPKGLLGRNPDGSYAVGHPLLAEVDLVAFSGTLSF